MSLLCKAFAYQPCSNKNYVLNTVICCHDCPDYKYCAKRCNNKPSICGKSEGLEEEWAGGRRTRHVAKYNKETGELLEVYASAKNAADANNLLVNSLYSTIRKKNGTLGGFKWGYVDGQTN